MNEEPQRSPSTAESIGCTIVMVVLIIGIVIICTSGALIR